MIFFVILFFMASPLHASGKKTTGRFFISGDDKIHLMNPKTGQEGEIHYRSTDGSFSKEKIQEINRIFGVPAHSPESISLRLIALLDYIQDHLRGGVIKIVSGYRSPEYNDGLRKKGRLAAKTSMHLEGMAADIDIEGINGRRLWKFARSLHCCGAGYYHGKGIHIDVGPNRFWDEKSTKVDQNLGGHNRLVLLRTEYDVYHPGETVHMTLGRITDYPVGVRLEAVLISGNKKPAKIRIFPEGPESKNCLPLKNREETHALSWVIPKDLQEPGKLQIRIDFCDRPFAEMPESTLSNLILIRE